MIAITELKCAVLPSARSSRRRLSPNAVSEMTSQAMASRNQVQSRPVSRLSDSASVCRPITMPAVTAPAASTATAIRRPYA